MFYRINTIHVVLPPLKERKEDIASLADYFLDHHANSCVGGKKEMHPSVRELLHAYHWPGNIRELKNLVERLVLLSGTSKIIEVQHIPREILAEIHPGLAARSHAKSAKLAYALKTVEKAMICEELKKANGNKTYAARALGISRASLNNKIAEFR